MPGYGLRLLAPEDRKAKQARVTKAIVGGLKTMAATAAGSRSGLSGGGGGPSPCCLADWRALRGGDGVCAWVCACVVSASGVL